MKKILLIILLIISAITLIIAFHPVNKQLSIVQIQNRVNELKEGMNLSDWNIEVKGEQIPAHTETLLGDSAHVEYTARVEPVPEYYSATIYVNTDKLSDVNDYVLKHEMYHILFSEYKNNVIHDLKPTQDQVIEMQYNEERLMEKLNNVKI